MTRRTVDDTALTRALRALAEEETRVETPAHNASMNAMLITIVVRRLTSRHRLSRKIDHDQLRLDGYTCC